MRNYTKKSSDREKREIRNRQEEQRQRYDLLEKNKKQKQSSKKTIFAISLIFLFLIGGALAYGSTLPGKYDTFAQCLTDKGVVMKGEDWCQYTNAQKKMFGKSFKYINYEVEPGLKLRPTWIIDGKKYETVQSFQTLSALSGCEY